MSKHVFHISPSHVVIAGACSKDETRPTMNHVNFRSDGVVEVADGHILAQLTPEQIDLIPPEAGTSAIMVHRDQMKIIKPILGKGDGTMQDADGKAILIKTEFRELICNPSLLGRWSGAPFPETKPLVESARDGQFITVTLDAKQLQQICSMVNRLTFKELQARITLNIPVGEDEADRMAIRWRSENTTPWGELLSGLITKIVEFEKSDE